MRFPRHMFYPILFRAASDTMTNPMRRNFQLGMKRLINPHSQRCRIVRGKLQVNNHLLPFPYNLSRPPTWLERVVQPLWDILLGGPTQSAPKKPPTRPISLQNDPSHPPIRIICISDTQCNPPSAAWRYTSPRG